ncbi:MAG: alanine racemase [Candidatus Kerfeldbacteria bacterium]|nr:alanine racemase [Candidatus Kerfeldbacteria bacterium]
MPSRFQRTWIELSRSALRHNMAQLQQLVGSQVQLMPIVKANAYGHGVRQTVDALGDLRRWGFGVATGAEGLQLRTLQPHGRILVLSSWQPAQLRQLVKAQLELAVWDEVSLAAIQSLPQSLRRQARVHLKLDTGTTRIGFQRSDLPVLYRRLARQVIHVVGIFSHFANAEEAGQTRTKQQLHNFTTLLDALHIPLQEIDTHMACTAAAMAYPGARFGLIRPGMGLYGLWPSPQIQARLRATHPTFQLQPVLSWKSRLLQIKTVPAGTAVGYGSTWHAPRRMSVGVVPVGYADGYDRHWSNAAWVTIAGKRAPVIGRVCMNMFMVDLRHIRRPRPGQEVTLLGPGITADTLAALQGTINYEVTTRLSPDIQRILTR